MVTAINDAWLTGRFDDLGAHFDDDIVMVTPDGAARVTGRADGVQTFVEFAERVTVERFEAFEVDVDAWDDTAIAAYDFDILYEMGGQRFDESGRDVWVFRRSVDGWRARWRTQLPAAS